MSYYQRHIFFCINQRDQDSGKECCQNHDAERFAKYAKQKAKELGIHGPGQVRVNKAGCLDRCEMGPVAVVYPDEVWYGYESEADIDAIVERHLRDGEVVDELRLDIPALVKTEATEK
ncbi:MAG: (2Fe-2S) ferredoxin domain-containing protein [Gammaproteobacteria bacterium]|nr:(2Fe-2S) ferredoxin domain-containing protein [Gammaproteobacteria bacterium]